MNSSISGPLTLAFVCAMLFAFPTIAKTDNAPDERPPAGLAQTTAKLDDVLAAARKADGSDRRWTNNIEEGRVAM